MDEWTDAERKRRDVSKIVQDYQEQLADVRLEMVELRSQLADLKPAIDRMRRVSELPAQWRARKDNKCAAELEKALNG